MGDGFWTVMQLERWLNGITLIMSLVGASFSTYAVARTLRIRFLLRSHYQYSLQRRSVIRLHLTVQIGVWICQAILLIVSGLMWTLPLVPWAMYAGAEEGRWVIKVLMLRKIARLTTSLVLFVISLYTAYWLRKNDRPAAVVPRRRA